MNLVIFAAQVNRCKVSCVWISSYSFMRIPLNLYMCLGHGLKMCIFTYSAKILITGLSLSLIPFCIYV